MLFGAHVSGGVKGAVARGAELGCDAIQLFSQSPRTWRHPAHDPAILARFREDRASSGIAAVVIHALYLCNLASPDDEFYERSRAALRATMATASGIGAEAVVVHVGSHLGSGLPAAMGRIVPAAEELLELTTDDLWLCLENCAGAGGTIGRSTDELAVIVEALDRHPRLGICLDSCHWWASGVDVTDPAVLADAVAEIGSSIGLERIRCLHVNDSETPLGSNRDRHASVGIGLMGNGIEVFLAHPALEGLPAILETPGPDGHGADAEEVKRLRGLYGKGD